MAATLRVFQAAKTFFNWPDAPLHFPSLNKKILTPLRQGTWQTILQQVYDPMMESGLFKSTLTSSKKAIGEQFESLRQHYTLRHECSAYPLDIQHLDPQTQALCHALGFNQQDPRLLTSE